MRKILILGVGLAISQSAAAVGIVSSYAPILFEQVGLGAKSALFQTALLGAIATVASIIAMFVVDRFGRRPVYILGAFLILVCHLTLWYSFKTVSYEITPTAIEQVQKAHPTFNVEPLQEKIGTTFKSDLTFKSFLSKNYDAKFLTLNDNVFIKAFVTFSVSPSVIVFIIFLFKFAFFFSVGPLMWVVLSEIVPLYMRSFAIPFFGLVCGIVSWTTPKYFLWQLDVMGTANTFLFYGILAIAALIFIVVYLPETKNKTIEEVGEMLIKN